MSSTIVRAKRQTTLPEAVCEAAGIHVRDQVDWRYEAGEIRGRKMVPARGKIRKVRPVKFRDLLILPPSVEVDFDAVRDDLQKEREERNERLLG